MPKDYLIATYTGPAALVDGVTRLREHGFKIYDVYTPCPVHGLEEAMGLRRSRLGYVAFAAGAVGFGAAIAFQFYAAVFDWRLNVGGKPDNSTLAFIPITFELTILAAGLATAKLFLARSRLFPGSGGAAPPRVTDDRFALALRREGERFDAEGAARLLARCGAVETRCEEVP